MVQKFKPVTLARGGQQRTFDTPEAVVKARHDGWVEPAAAKAQEQSSSAPAKK